MLVWHRSLSPPEKAGIKFFLWLEITVAQKTYTKHAEMTGFPAAELGLCALLVGSYVTKQDPNHTTQEPLLDPLAHGPCISETKLKEGC